MDEKIKILAQRVTNNIYRKVKVATKSIFFRLGNNVGIGADGTVTKYIDQVAEDAALNVIKRSKLKINILSEEVGFIDNGAKYTFVLDPIDGTRNAYRGIPFYSVSLGVGKKSLSDIEYGIVQNIPTGDIFTAEKGIGAFYNKKQIMVPEIPDKEILSSIALGSNYDKYTLRQAKKEKVRSFGSSSLEMCMVAIGAIDYYLVGKEYIRIVDIAASTLIVREAGGIVTNILGKDLDMPFNLDERSSVVAACNRNLINSVIQ